MIFTRQFGAWSKRPLAPTLSAFAVLAAMPLFAGDAITEVPAVVESASQVRPDMPAQIPGLPEPVTAKHFDALTTHSPFLRSVGLSDSIVLTGIARFEGDVFATLFDTDSRESHLVSATANQNGWQLVDVGGDETDLESLTAKVQIAGGELISIRYEKLPEKLTRGGPGGGANGGSSSGNGSTKLSSRQLEEAKKAARNYKDGFSSDGYPDKPPSEVVKKLQKISESQRESINRRMIELRNRGLGMDERRRIYNDMVDRSAQGKR
jgi:hypothetical protein